MPSIADLIFIALLAVLVFTSLSVRLLGDAGIGWHIRTGQLILSNHSIPHTDAFSSSLNGKPWFAWEWLYDIVVGWLDLLAGLNGVVFLTAVLIAVTFSLSFRLLVRRGTNLFVALALVLLAASASMIHFFTRPHVVSWLFAVVWFWILSNFECSETSSPAEIWSYRRVLFLLPLLMLIWVNVHGAFLLGFALLGIYWLCAAWDWLRPNGDRIEDVLEEIRAGNRVRDLTLVALLSAFATFANPYGWKLHLHIYRYLSNRFLIDHIEEFQSPNFHGIAEKCFAVLILAALAALALRKRESRVQASEVLIALFSVYSGLYAARNIPVSSLLLIFVTGPRLSNAFRSPEKASFSQRMQRIDSLARGHLWALAVAVITCWIVFHAGSPANRPLVNAHFDTKRFPIAAVDQIEKFNLPGPLFAPDYWGGYLIYRLYPQDKVVIDDRHDFYGEEFLKEYLKTIHVEPGWEDFLNQHPAGCVIVPKASALANILLETPHWRLIYDDNTAVIFSKSP